MSQFARTRATRPFLPALRTLDYDTSRFARQVDVRPMRFLLPEVDWRNRGVLPDELRGRCLSSIRLWRGRVERWEEGANAWVVWVAEVPAGRSYEVDLTGVALHLGQSVELWTALELTPEGWTPIDPVVVAE